MMILKIFLLDASIQLVGLVAIGFLCLIYYGIKALVERNSVNKWVREQEAKKRALINTLPEYHENYTDISGGYKYVDLGLPSGTLWATCNIGASNPGELGFFFKWGAVTPSNRIYKRAQTYNVPILDPSHDAASANWGGAWRMPTKEEFDELIGSCTWIAEKCSDTMGFKIVGPNKNSIFLPLAGFYCYDSKEPLDVNNDGYYWTCQQSVSKMDEAFALIIHDDGNKNTLKSWKLSIKPIRPVFTR